MNIESMARYWSQDAENYGDIIRKELASFRVKAWQNYLREKLPADTHKVLDLGCGPGFFSIILAKMGYEVTAVDCSEGMLAQARQLVKRAGLEITLQQKDINHPEFPDDSFDAIVSRNVTWTLSNPWQVYAECQRMLRTCGRLLLFDANWNTDITEPFDPLQLPLSGIKRPYWDVELLRNMGFGDVHTEFDVTDKLWDEKERLLYGETPMFGVFATKF